MHLLNFINPSWLSINFFIEALKKDKVVPFDPQDIQPISKLSWQKWRVLVFIVLQQYARNEGPFHASGTWNWN